jgi:hypothetical protein
MIRPGPKTLLATFSLVAACSAADADGTLRPVVESGSVDIRTTDSVATLLAAGDIAACTWGAWATAQLLDTLAGEIIIAGDAAYVTSRDPNPFLTCFDSTWGRHKQRVRPVPGNHDAGADGMKRYFEYFGAAAGPRPGGYYSFDVGRWHVLALNSTIDMRRGSSQWKWAAADLAAHPSRCTLAYMHHPRFSSGPHRKQRSAISIFPLLDERGVDVIVSAHDHIYERFAPQNAKGQRDLRGVRQFVVGTGGNRLYDIERLQPNSEAHTNGDHGVLKLTLGPTDYAWEFVTASMSGFRDSGSALCY